MKAELVTELRPAASLELAQVAVADHSSVAIVDLGADPHRLRRVELTSWPTEPPLVRTVVATKNGVVASDGRRTWLLDKPGAVRIVDRTTAAIPTGAKLTPLEVPGEATGIFFKVEPLETGARSFIGRLNWQDHRFERHPCEVGPWAQSLPGAFEPSFVNFDARGLLYVLTWPDAIAEFDVGAPFTFCDRSGEGVLLLSSSPPAAPSISLLAPSARRCNRLGVGGQNATWVTDSEFVFSALESGKGLCLRLFDVETRTMPRLALIQSPERENCALETEILRFDRSSQRLLWGWSVVSEGTVAERGLIAVDLESQEFVCISGQWWTATWTG
ncbi:MAG TPA: hypothetical protein PKA88_24470 [Polyangiaceae bacterium]|nr:hypothetical protein [Polyangiaceae bacterium]